MQMSDEPRFQAQVAADLLGLLVLAGLTLVAWQVASQAGIPASIWIAAYLVLVVGSLSMWHGPKSDELHFEPKTLLIASLVFGSIFFVADVIFAHSIGPALEFGKQPDARTVSLGSPLTLLVCPGLSFVAFASAARNKLASRALRRDS
jgi:hypothetical protein